MQRILEQYGDKLTLETVEKALYCDFLMQLMDGEYDSCEQVVRLMKELSLV